jgi:hypothetical protein
MFVTLLISPLDNYCHLQQGLAHNRYFIAAYR